MGRQLLSVAGPLDDNLVAGIGQPIQGAIAQDGKTEGRNLQLLCSYCNRVKGTKGEDGYWMNMAELRADKVATGVMVDEGLAALTGKRLARNHRGDLQV